MSHPQPLRLSTTSYRFPSPLAYSLRRHVFTRRSAAAALTLPGVAKLLCKVGTVIDTTVDTPVSCLGTLEYMAPELLWLPNASAAVLAAQRANRLARYTEKVSR